MTSSTDEIRLTYEEMTDGGKDMWDLPSARSLVKLFNPASLALRYENKQQVERLGIAWEGVDVNVGSGTARVEIRVVDEMGDCHLSETTTGRCFPPTRSGVMWGSPLNNADWGELCVYVTISHLLPQPPNNADAHLVVAERSQLWAAAHSLIKQSEYFRKLLTGEFTESTVRSGAKLDAGPEVKVDGEQQHRDFEDSDDETDAATTHEVKHTQATTLPHRVVHVKDTAYTTYFATLVWVGSRWIRLAPLRSILTPSQTVGDMIETSPQVPAPASPKSVYRLAHLLDLRDLQDLALANIASQLTEENAATELFSDVASAYPEVCDVILAYVLKHWRGVLASKGWKTIKELCDAQVLPIGGMYTAILLTEKLSSLGGLGHA
ncbi:hypothetical protein C6P46_004207 [Rhodotorula mucilaginosa]|uniref:BTB domain-containing protein n=1 Tax=Rhodotorula mucilaginosa TaxID=5537 RepID=A0A9P7B6L8_RHOMI|nr:hypothetical protein C6P46_004207 [Rhodotorula mucilaginosa]